MPEVTRSAPVVYDGHGFWLAQKIVEMPFFLVAGKMKPRG
jgi:hypothetical protein